MRFGKRLAACVPVLATALVSAFTVPLVTAALAQTSAVGSPAEKPDTVRVAPWRSLRLGNYRALVLGIDDYPYLAPAGARATSVADAQAVAQLLLDRYGFSVTTVGNATRRTMFDQLAKLRAQVTVDDRLLLYYAGRCQVDEGTGRSYWLPADARANDPATWIATAELADQLQAMKAGHVLVLADTCYAPSGPYAQAAPRAGEERARFLERISKMRSRTVLASNERQPVLGPGSSHSVFTKAVLEVLRNNAKPAIASELFGSAPGAYAVIEGAGHEGGDFIFVPHTP